MDFVPVEPFFFLLSLLAGALPILVVLYVIMLVRRIASTVERIDRRLDGGGLGA